MFKKVGAIGVLGAAIAVVAATTLSGTAAARVAAGSRDRLVQEPGHDRRRVSADRSGCVDRRAAVRLGRVRGDQVERKPLGEDQARPGRHPARERHVARDRRRQAFKNNAAMVAVTGPAGSQEMQDTASIWQRRRPRADLGLGDPCRAHARRDRSTARGRPRRVLLPDGAERRSAGLITSRRTSTTSCTRRRSRSSTTVRRTAPACAIRSRPTLDRLPACTVTTNHITQSDTNFSSVIASIPVGHAADLHPVAALLAGAELLHPAARCAVRARSRCSVRTARTTPSTFEGAGSYVSAFPYAPTNPTVKAFANSHGGDTRDVRPSDATPRRWSTRLRSRPRARRTTTTSPALQVRNADPEDDADPGSGPARLHRPVPLEELWQVPGCRATWVARPASASTRSSRTGRTSASGNRSV